MVKDSDLAHVWFPKRDKTGEIINRRDDYLNSRAIKGKVVRRDVQRDLALVKLTSLPGGVPELSIAKERPQNGASVYTIGNPGVYDGTLWVFSSGTVNSYVKKWEGEFGDGTRVVANVLVTDHTTSEPGASGGPAVNVNGEVVGINQSGDKRAPLKKHCIDASEILEFVQRYQE